MNDPQNISVLGCGWLGLELAKILIDNGHSVKGSTTSAHKLKNLEAIGITPFLIKLSEHKVYGQVKDFLSGSTVLIINIPPGLRRNPKKNHIKEIKGLISTIASSGIQQLIFVSSTSVFEDRINFPVIDHDTIPDSLTSSGQQLKAIEEYLMNQKEWETTIIRPGGLFGEDRHPANQLSGRNNLQNPKAPINLIHRRDLMASILACIELRVYSTQLNVVYSYHPSKEDYYSSYCTHENLALPSFSHKLPSKGKIIDSSKTEQLLNLKFSHRP